jgi:hypothetical protein
MKLKIKVTREIICQAALCGKTDEYKILEGGTKLITENCAIAVAIRELFPEASVGGERIYPWGYGHFSSNMMCAEKTGYGYIYQTENSILLPPVAQEFIRAFDTASVWQRVDEMEPVEFEINIPSTILDKITIDDLTRVTETSEFLEVV